MQTTDDTPAAAAALGIERAQLDAVLDAAGDGVLIRRDERWLANAAAQRLLGLPDERLPAVEALRLRALDGEPVASGTPLPERFRVRATSLDGRELLLEGSWSSEPAPVVVFRDARERDRREHFNAEFLRTLLDTVPTAINVVEPETRRVVATNRAFLDLVGLELDEVLDVTPPYPWWSGRESTYALGDGIRYGRTFGRRDGGEVPVEIALRELRDPQGEVTAVLGVISDLSERRRFERQLAQSGKLAALGELAAGVAHEINNPLFAILGLVEFVLADVEPGSKAHERLRLVHTTALEIKEIVRALLDFARESSESRCDVALDEVVHDTVELVRRTSAHRGIELVEELGPGPLLVHGSPNQLKQIFLNLIANARQALPDGGTIALRVAAEGDSVTATVADTGPGIAADVLPRVFEPFFTTRRADGGTGLGLSVSLGIAEAHGGSLTAESPPGGGARLTLRLPRGEA